MLASLIGVPFECFVRVPYECSQTRLESVGVFLGVEVLVPATQPLLEFYYERFVWVPYECFVRVLYECSHGVLGYPMDALLGFPMNAHKLCKASL